MCLQVSTYPPFPPSANISSALFLVQLGKSFSFETQVLASLLVLWDNLLCARTVVLSGVPKFLELLEVRYEMRWRLFCMGAGHTKAFVQVREGLSCLCECRQ